MFGKKNKRGIELNRPEISLRKVWTLSLLMAFATVFADSGYSLLYPAFPLLDMIRNVVLVDLSYLLVIWLLANFFSVKPGRS